MQTEADSLRGTGSYEVASAAELQGGHCRGTLVHEDGVRRQAGFGGKDRKKNARVVVRGMFRPQSPNEEPYTANADIASVRAVFAASVPHKANAKAIDVKTALLDAQFPESFQTVYVRPPQALIDVGLVEHGTVRRVLKAIYGFRISPKAWGVERDHELKRMIINVQSHEYVFEQSHIDPSVWAIVRGKLNSDGVGVPAHRSFTAEAAGSEAV